MEGAPTPKGLVLDRLARIGAAKILMEAMEAEVVKYPGRLKYERKGEFRGYRNGHGRHRTIAAGLGHVEMHPPCLRAVLLEKEEFRSKILDKYQQMSLPTRNLLAGLYLEGFYSGDFEPLFRHLLPDPCIIFAK